MRPKFKRTTIEKIIKLNPTEICRLKEALISIGLFSFLIYGVEFGHFPTTPASTAVMFAEQYDSNAPYAAQHVFMTTLFAVLTIPLVGTLLFA